jgi:hypothetical protein
LGTGALAAFNATNPASVARLLVVALSLIVGVVDDSGEVRSLRGAVLPNRS